ncbi:MAG: C40 family peptidase [Acidimicrobiales bacterium]
MSAGASSVATLQQQAAVLAQQIQTDYAKLDVLDEGYNQAHLRVTQLQAQVLTATRSIGRAEKTLAQDNVRLRTMAIDAYVDGDISSGLTMLLNGASKQLPMQQAYLQAASGNLGQAEATVTNARHSLSDRRGALLADERGAKAAQQKIADERSLAQKITAQLESELATVKGNLAQAVAAAEQQRQLQAEAAAEAAALANQQRINQQNSAPPQNLPPVSGGGSGAVAVRAAESQLGVPYVWGGATPGVGFDCSGLTMWSWEQAGVSLAHGATDQYYEIAHVSMSNLQPGDLIFYGDSGYLYHVVMYVGSGPYGGDTVIQAEETGTNVMFTPIPPGAYGAGQP